jgi:hypothetical protein
MSHRKGQPSRHVEAIMKPANDNNPRTGATPLGTRLARAGRKDDLRRLVQYGRVPVAVTWLSADGGLPEAGTKPQADRVTEIRPSPDEIVRLAVQAAIAARGAVGPITPTDLEAAAARNVRRDKRGRISDWRGSDGKWRPAAELFRQPKGKRRKSEQERKDDNARHLSLRGSGGFPEPIQRSTVPSVGEDFRRLRAAHWVMAMGPANDNARVNIDRAGVGGQRTFEDAWRNAGLPPACRVPRFMTAIAPGAEFLGFRQHRNATASKGSFVGARDAVESQIVAAMDQPRVDAALGEHGKILDMSIAGMTARQIAAELGWGAGRQGERKAVAAQDAALAALGKMAA